MRELDANPCARHVEAEEGEILRRRASPRRSAGRDMRGRRGERKMPGSRSGLWSPTMFKHILIPTDGSDLSRKALLYGVELARESKAKVTALTIREPYTITSLDTFTLVGSQEEFEESTREIAERALEQARMAGEAAG